MRRIVVSLMLGLALALALAAPASAAKRTYIGDVAAGGAIGFDLKIPKHGKKKVKDLTFAGVPITCAEGANTTSGVLNFSLTVNKKKKFKGAASNKDDALLAVKGKVSKNGSKGNIQVSGPAPLDDGTSGTECDTGKLKWSADRA